MCILYSFSITIIRDSPFSLSLFTDIIVISDYIEEMMALQTYLAKEFKIKDLSKLR